MFRFLQGKSSVHYRDSPACSLIYPVWDYNVQGSPTYTKITNALYMQVGEFPISRRPSSVPQTQIWHNMTFFFKFQNLRKAGDPLCK